MSTNRDNMVITPHFITDRDSGPIRRAEEARKTERVKRKRRKIMKTVRDARRARQLKAAKAARVAKGGSALSGLASKGGRIGSRMMGHVGVALLVMDAVNVVGSVARQAEGGVSGRLLTAMDQDDIYSNLDENATGAANSRKSIEGDEDLLRIIGMEGRVNSQIAQLGAYFREKETAIATGSDLIEREPGFDHLGTITDQVIDKASSGIKTGADSFINAIRGWSGKGDLVR
tara:strand:- start:3855 stop:4547 length:693 start_codon:yes stop_codon:yes gene_type:complete